MFPLNPILDAFDRADGNPVGGGGYYSVTGSPRIVSEELAPASVVGAFQMIWGDYLSAESEVYITCLNGTAFYTSSNDQTLFLLWNPSTNSGYAANWGLSATKLYSISNNVWTALTTTFTTYPWMKTPCQIGFRATPAFNLEMYYNGYKFKEYNVGSYPIDSYYIGIGFNPPTNAYRYDDLGGGIYDFQTIPGSLRQKGGTISEFDPAFVGDRAWF